MFYVSLDNYKGKPIADTQDYEMESKHIPIESHQIVNSKIRTKKQWVKRWQ